MLLLTQMFHNFLHMAQPKKAFHFHFWESCKCLCKGERVWALHHFYGDDRAGWPGCRLREGGRARV